MDITFWQWMLVLATSILLFIFSPLAKTSEQFFHARHKGKSPNWIWLTGSLVISWVFAKSIANAADLGARFGMTGGLAYACYYLSFIVAGFVIYFLRKKGGFHSIHHFLGSRFGRGALIIFSVVIAFRLFNEIWSNTMVIGLYFGEQGSVPYYWSILIFTALTLAYSLKGGLNSSIFSDGIQMILFGVLLTAILFLLFQRPDFNHNVLAQKTSFSWEGGLNLLLVAVLQSFSYPFHDPVLTDRGFISPLRTTLRSFILAGIIGGLCIFLFSFLGIASGDQQPGPQQIGSFFGPIMLLLVNFIMIVSAASTLDSTFSSFSKLAILDLKLGHGVRFGRLTMIIVALGGTIPLLFDPAILSATTISGTMVVGLTPVFLFWWIKVPKISFYLSVLAGIFVGILLVLQLIPKGIILSPGPYGELLWANVFALLICLLLYFVPYWLKRKRHD
ncbi:MAG: sodium:solute symporter [Bacteroidetes bacterium]|nr:MAG: sodium:solute symporter [Bacteroidota bacterium]